MVIAYLFDWRVANEIVYKPIFIAEKGFYLQLPLSSDSENWVRASTWFFQSLDLGEAHG